ncbi:MAG: enolase C-terminal domain-like protein [Thermomicrobiales bacterium]
MPIHRLLGGPTRERVRAYANGPRGDTPEEMAASATALVARGYTALKMAPWDAMPILASRNRIEAGVAKVRAVREAVGPDVELMVDAHGRLSPAVAVRAAEMLAPIGLTFLEEPSLPQNKQVLARLARKAAVPIAVGERHYTRWDFDDLLASRTVSAAGHHPERWPLRGSQDRRAGRDAFRRRGAAQPLELGQHDGLAPPRRGAAELPDAGGDHRSRAGRTRSSSTHRSWTPRASSPCPQRRASASRSTWRRPGASRR